MLLEQVDVRVCVASLQSYFLTPGQPLRRTLLPNALSLIGARILTIVLGLSHTLSDCWSLFSYVGISLITFAGSGLSISD